MKLITFQETMPRKETGGSRVLRSAAATIVATCVTISTGGCIPIPGKGGVTHHIVIGFGVVSVREGEKDAVVATHVNALGVAISDRPGMKLGVGYTESTVVSVNQGAEDVRIEVSRVPGGPLVVECPRARLSENQ